MWETFSLSATSSTVKYVSSTVCILVTSYTLCVALYHSNWQLFTTILKCGHGYRSGPAGAGDTPEPGPQKGLETVDTNESSVFRPREASEDHHPHACTEGRAGLPDLHRLRRSRRRGSRASGSGAVPPLRG